MVGKVMDAKTGSAINGVTIRVYNLETDSYLPGHVITNKDGRFSLCGPDFKGNALLIEFADNRYKGKVVKPHYASGNIILEPIKRLSKGRLFIAGLLVIGVIGYLAIDYCTRKKTVQ